MVFKYKGTDIYYEVHGAGEPLILLHGFLETSTMWRSLIPEFKSSHRVLVLDLLGHGQSGCLGYVHSMDTMAEVVKELMTHLHMEKATLIGHSMGGYVALALRHSHPELVHSICLMNSTFESDSAERKEIRERSIEMAKTNYNGLIRMSFSNLFAAESKLNFKQEYEEALKIALTIPVQGYIAAQSGMQNRKNHLDTFIKTPGKKALIIGKKDTLVDDLKIRDILNSHPVEIVEFSEGHMSHIENMYDLTYFLLRFIQN